MNAKTPDQGLYGAPSDNRELAIEYANGKPDFVVTFDVLPSAKLVDVTRGEGLRVWEQYKKKHPDANYDSFADELGIKDQSDGLSLLLAETMKLPDPKRQEELLEILMRGASSLGDRAFPTVLAAELQRTPRTDGNKRLLKSLIDNDPKRGNTRRRPERMSTRPSSTRSQERAAPTKPSANRPRPNGRSSRPSSSGVSPRRRADYDASGSFMSSSSAFGRPSSVSCNIAMSQRR